MRELNHTKAVHSWRRQGEMALKFLDQLAFYSLPRRVDVPILLRPDMREALQSPRDNLLLLLGGQRLARSCRAV
jgi:hypothetical protein